PFNPLTKYRCKNRKTIIIGMMERIDPAAINFQSDANVPVNMFTPRGNVYISWSSTIIRGHKKSSHDDTKVNMANVIIEGLTEGIMIFLHIWKLLAPSILADSSSSYGTVNIPWRMMNTPKAVVICGKIIPAYVFCNPRCNAKL